MMRRGEPARLARRTRRSIGRLTILRTLGPSTGDSESGDECGERKERWGE